MTEKHVLTTRLAQVRQHIGSIINITSASAVSAETAHIALKEVVLPLEAGEEEESRILLVSTKTKLGNTTLSESSAAVGSKFLKAITDAIAAAYSSLHPLKSEEIVIHIDCPYLASCSAARVQSHVARMIYDLYAPAVCRFKSKNQSVPYEKLTLAISSDEAVRSSRKILYTAESMLITGVIVDCPSNLKSVPVIEDAVELICEIGRDSGCSLKMLNKEKQDNFPLVDAVAQGNPDGSVVVHMTLPIANCVSESDIGIIGKGIIFDCGGLSIKGEMMKYMKLDLGGAATLLGVANYQMRRLRGDTGESMQDVLGEPATQKKLHFVLPFCENSVDALSYRPGDIIYGRNGKSVAVTNTDAEGRLVMADCLTYVQEIMAPGSVVMDVSTLTGAVMMAAGHHYAGMMTKDKRIKRSLDKIGKEVKDRVLPIPLSSAYQPSCKSTFCDLSQEANMAGTPKHIFAAIFLSRYVDSKYRFCHLDIAGASCTSNYELATARPVALLTQMLHDGLNQS